MITLELYNKKLHLCFKKNSLFEDSFLTFFNIFNKLGISTFNRTSHTSIYCTDDIYMPLLEAYPFILFKDNSLYFTKDLSGSADYLIKNKIDLTAYIPLINVKKESVIKLDSLPNTSSLSVFISDFYLIPRYSLHSIYSLTVKEYSGFKFKSAAQKLSNILYRLGYVDFVFKFVLYKGKPIIYSLGSLFNQVKLSSLHKNKKLMKYLPARWYPSTVLSDSTTKEELVRLIKLNIKDTFSVFIHTPVGVYLW
jgi:hypothetical protein